VNADAIVVGAGVIGAAVADALTAAGMRVLVIDQSFAASGTTAAGMGHVVVMDDSPAQLALTTWSTDLFAEVAGELPRECELDRCGTLWLAEDDAQLDMARARGASLMAYGVRADILDSIALRDAEPNVRPGLAGALHVPGDCVVYPPAFCAFLLRRAVVRGAQVVKHTVVRGVTARSVTTDAGMFHADCIVNAAGIGAAQLTPGLPIVPRKGHLVITERHPGFCRHQLVELGYMRSAHVMSAESVAFNVQPRLTGQVLIGSSRELVGLDDTINRRIVTDMLARAAAFMPGIVNLVALRTWTGFRPATADKLPLIGETASGVWVAAGHEGLGITTSLGSARLLADLMLQRVPAIDPQPYSPVRMLAPA
jgi:D-hydroxyproline dehydrogenase subunit beta